MRTAAAELFNLVFTINNHCRQTWALSEVSGNVRQTFYFWDLCGKHKIIDTKWGKMFLFLNMLLLFSLPFSVSSVVPHELLFQEFRIQIAKHCQIRALALPCLQWCSGALQMRVEKEILRRKPESFSEVYFLCAGIEQHHSVHPSLEFVITDHEGELHINIVSSYTSSILSSQHSSLCTQKQNCSALCWDS